MVDASLFNALTAREFMDDKVLEAYLTSRPGLIGAIGFRKIAESYDEMSRERDGAVEALAKANANWDAKWADEDALKKRLEKLGGKP